MSEQVEVYRASDGWRFRHRAANGEIDAQGEAYENRADCVDTVARLFPDTPINMVEDEK